MFHQTAVPHFLLQTPVLELRPTDEATCYFPGFRKLQISLKLDVISCPHPITTSVLLKITCCGLPSSLLSVLRSSDDTLVCPQSHNALTMLTGFIVSTSLKFIYLKGRIIEKKILYLTPLMPVIIGVKPSLA